MKRSDPLGKRALFSNTPDEPPHRAGALDLAVRCSACQSVRTASLPELVVQALPLWFWMPGRKPGHLMRCTSCHELAWHDVSRAR